MTTLITNGLGIGPDPPSSLTGFRPILATAAPRDAASGLYHPHWLSLNRPGTFVEAAVRPGSTATFVFPTRAPAETLEQKFQVVVDHVMWLPNTGFRVRGIVPANGPTLYPSQVHACESVQSGPTHRHRPARRQKSI
jgi:hypothetical protein